MPKVVLIFALIYFLVSAPYRVAAQDGATNPNDSSQNSTASEQATPAATPMPTPSVAQDKDNSTQPASVQTTTSQNNVVTPPAGFVLLDGTPVKLRLSRNLSSGTDRKGDTVDFEVVEDVLIDGVVVIPKGGEALATITEAEPRKHMGRGGKLDVNIDSVRLKDNEKVALRAVKDNKGGGHVGAMTGAMVATAIVFFPAAPLFLFMKGKDVNIPKGTEVTAYIDGDAKLDRAKLDPAYQAAAMAATSVPAQTTVSVNSTPSGADVEVDGSFVGNTPSQVTLPAGDHTVKVSKTGFKPWERNLKVTSGGAVNLNAELEAAQ